MSGVARPTLTVGLPVHNGELLLPAALDSLLAQTYDDVEFVVSDNASTDRTPQICQDYAARDDRVRYVRQSVNLGAAANHNVVAALARGRYFSWASSDDVYAPTLLERCVERLESDPTVVLVRSREAAIDERGIVLREEPAAAGLADPRPWFRLRSLVGGPRADDIYGVVRTEVLRRIPPHGSYGGADRTLVAALCLQGPFGEVPEVLYFRREHADQASRAPGRRGRAAVLDPVRADRWRHPMVRMRVEQVVGHLAAVRRAEMDVRDTVRCLVVLAGHVIRPLGGGRRLPTTDRTTPLLVTSPDRAAPT